MVPPFPQVDSEEVIAGVSSTEDEPPAVGVQVARGTRAREGRDDTSDGRANALVRVLMPKKNNWIDLMIWDFKKI